MRSYFDALLRYFEFSGRTGRAQYWLFQLFALIFTTAAVFVDFQAGHPLDGTNPGPLFVFMTIFHVVPQVTTTVRRLHDIGKSGWWYLICFVPLGAFVVLWWTCRASVDGSNPYGGDQGSGGRSPVFARRSPATIAAQQMLARMEARRGVDRLVP